MTRTIDKVANYSCIKTGCNIKIGDTSYRGDLHRSTDGRIYAVINPNPIRPTDRYEVEFTGIVDIYPKYDDEPKGYLIAIGNPQQMIVTPEFYDKLVDINDSHEQFMHLFDKTAL